MSSVQAAGKAGADLTPARTVDMKFEFIVVPVSDVDRAKNFYVGLGWKLDMDFVRGDDFRVVQFTPPGSPASIVLGRGITLSAPGSAKDLYLVVSDIARARAELLARGARVSEIFHDAGGVFHQAGTAGRLKGPAPQHRSYGSFAEFEDPDGNGWRLQEVTVRLPGHGSTAATTFHSSVELAGALHRAQEAYGKHQARMGLLSDDPLAWYADYIVIEQAGKPLPT